ncbi:Biotin/acetyl-CoA-carboxylase ligase [uncultured Paludibacter sp.]|nr:Biotin/acetyl-CoA-carboxylase ligase [uncultured Paludibacter sp.]
MKNSLYIKSTSSTNDFLKDLIRKNTYPEGFTVYSDFQISGKGQQGNKWEAEKGKNLLFSFVIFPSHIFIYQQFIVSQIISIAIKGTLDKYIDDVKIKWPNDIYWKNYKIGGILIENSLQNNTIKSSIIGVGLNINQQEFSNNLPNPVSLKLITNKRYIRKKILQEIRENFMFLYKKSSFEEIKKEYFQGLFHNDGYYKYQAESGDIFSAKILKINDDGKLILETKNGLRQEFYFKEVQFII